MIIRFDLEDRMKMDMKTGDSEMISTILISGRDDMRRPAKKDQLILLVGDSYPALLRQIADWLDSGRSFQDFKTEMEAEAERSANA